MESVEQFLARGGKIQSVEEGARASSEREMYLATRAPDAVCERAVAADPVCTVHSMRDAENQKGHYSPYYGQQ